MAIDGLLLRRAGAALYGDRWQSPLARDLGVALRTVQRWTDGDRAPPGDLSTRLDHLLTARATEISTVRRSLTGSPAWPPRVRGAAKQDLEQYLWPTPKR
jgi:hypothetical protein